MDPYEVLGIPKLDDKAANRAAGKRAYRKLARKWHPDHNQDPSAMERFQAIQLAYDQVMDKVIRKPPVENRPASYPYDAAAPSWSAEEDAAEKLRAHLRESERRSAEYLNERIARARECNRRESFNPYRWVYQ